MPNRREIATGCLSDWIFETYEIYERSDFISRSEVPKRIVPTGQHVPKSRHCHDRSLSLAHQ
jgi:hypothetical protein